MNDPQLQDRIKSVKSKIEKLIENGRLDEAKAALEQYDVKMPGDPEICSMRAVIAIMEGDLAKAESAIVEGLKKDSVQFDLLFNLAYIRELEGRLQDAVDLYCKAETVAFEDMQKQNVSEAIERIKSVNESIELRERARIVFFVNAGMDSFLGDIIEGLRDDYWVRKIIVSDLKQIDDGMEWADICWFEWCDELVEYGSKLPLAQQKKIVCRLHRYEAFTNNIQNVNWDNINKVIFVAEHIKDTVTGKVNLPPEKCEVIFNGVDAKKFGYKERKKGFNIAWIGYLNLRKNPMIVLQYFHELVKIDKRYKLHIAGSYQDEALRQYMEGIIKKLGLTENIIFYGFLPNHKMSEWLKDKNYLVTGSIGEGHPVGVMEAMSCGLKPVIHYFPGVEEFYLRDYIYYELEDYIRIITEIDYNSQEYHNYIVNNYSLKKQLMQINDLIKELMSFRNLVSNIKDILSGTVIPQELMREDITVLIPCYDRVKMLKEDLDNGFKLGSQPKLIVDDCSTEETQWLAKIEENEDVYRAKVIRRPVNEGTAQTRWTGLHNIGTKYITFLDDDDMLFCMDRDQAIFSINQLNGEYLLIIPRYVLNLSDNQLSLGYDRTCYDDCLAEDVLRRLASESEIRAMLAGGSIGVTEELKKYSHSEKFIVAEDIVMLSRILAANRMMKIRTTESLVHVRRVSNRTLSKTLSSNKLALGLIAQAIACYYCLQLGLAGKDEVLKWMKDRAALIQQLYNFGESFATELIAYLIGEVSEEVFIHFIALHGLELEDGLDGLAPELRKLRAMFYEEPVSEKWFVGMKDLPLVSIIIPTFNRRDMLKRAIDQVLKQDYPNIEVIVTDNASEDGTEEMVRSRYKDEKRVVYHRNEKNIGPAMNFRNAFYNLSNGEYCIGLCDDDYFVDSSYISSAVELFLANTNIAFVYSGIYYNHVIKNEVCRVKPDMPNIADGMDLFINFTTEKYPIMPNPSSLIFKKANAIKTDAFIGNPNRLASDLFFELRLLLTGDACFYDGIVLVYNLHDGSISRNTDVCIVDKSIDNNAKAVETASVDIYELFNIIALANKEKSIDDKIADRWLTYRIWKYMYWRINETARSIDECKALTDFLHREYPGIYDSLKHVAAQRFGKDIF